MIICTACAYTHVLCLCLYAGVLVWGAERAKREGQGQASDHHHKDTGVARLSCWCVCVCERVCMCMCVCVCVCRLASCSTAAVYRPTKSSYALSSKITTQSSYALFSKLHKCSSSQPPFSMCVQAGLFILQLLFPNTKQGKAKRQESIKLGVIEVCVHSNFSCTLMY